MRFHSPLLFAILVLLTAAACSNGKVKVEQPPADEVEFIAPMGKKIAGNLVSTLKGEVKAAMEQGGPGIGRLIRYVCRLLPISMHMASVMCDRNILPDKSFQVVPRWAITASAFVRRS